jgi:hypothetical protein
VTNPDISPTANIARLKLAAGTGGYVVINELDGGLSEEQRLSPVRGGTGSDSSTQSGIPHVLSGDWTYGCVDDVDVCSNADLARTKIESGTPGHVITNDDSTGLLTSEARLASKRGGTGSDSSGATGIPHVVAVSAFLLRGGVLKKLTSLSSRVLGRILRSLRQTSHQTPSRTQTLHPVQRYLDQR